MFRVRRPSRPGPPDWRPGPDRKAAPRTGPLSGAGRQAGFWIAGIVLGSLAAGIGGWFAGLFGDLLPSYDELACHVSEWQAERTDEARFTVLLASLDGDDGSQTDHIVEVFRDEGGFEVYRLCRTLALGAVGSMAAAELAALEGGRAWLEGHNADLLIWGEAVQPDAVLRLRFLPRSGEATAGSAGYALTETLNCHATWKIAPWATRGIAPSS